MVKIKLKFENEEINKSPEVQKCLAVLEEYLAEKINGILPHRELDGMEINISGIELLHIFALDDLYDKNIKTEKNELIKSLKHNLFQYMVNQLHLRNISVGV